MSSYYIPGSVLGTKDIDINKILSSFHWGARLKKSEQVNYMVSEKRIGISWEMEKVKILGNVAQDVSIEKVTIRT